jgi:two-component system chemotaxis response regulator CheY
MVRAHMETLRVSRGDAADAGFIVVEAETGRRALSLLTTMAPDLVVVDLGLAELSGYEFCERLRATGSLQHVPVLAISARTMPEDRAAAEEAGVSAFLAKPFTRRQLTEHVVPLFNGHSGD